MSRLLPTIAIAVIAAGAEAPDEGFVLRVPLSANVDTLRYIANLAEPSQQTVPASTPLPELMRRFYGASYVSFERIFREYNPEFGLARSGSVTIKVPVLPVWLPQTVLSPAQENTVFQLLAIHLGSNGKTTLERVAKLNPELKGQFFESAKTPVRVPYTTGYFRVQLKPELRGDAEKIYRELLALRTSGQILRVEKATTFRASPHWSPASVPAAAPLALQAPTEASAWPFRGLLADPLADARKGKVIIAVVDSGIDRDKDKPMDPDSRFPYWQDPGFGPDGHPQFGALSCGSVSIGCNLVSPGSFPADDVTKKDLQFHGTHVAGIAFARPISELKSQYKKDLDDRLQLMVLKVIDKDGNADSGNVAEALRIAGKGGAQIVNLSLSGKHAPVVDNKMKELESQLFVVAAGNQDQGPGLSLDDLGSDETVGYPARIASTLPNVITVAAHDEQGALASFSNYGRNSVHLAAPGVNILSTVGDGTYAEYSGTSQATPLVSLTAALLLASGFPASPPAIKNRLIASVDVDPAQKDLEEGVVSHGKLNISRALAYLYDEVTLRNGSVFKGTISSPSGLSIPQKPRAPWKSIAKIVLNYSVDPQKTHYVLLRSGTALDSWIGDLDLSSFDELIMVATGKGEVHIKTSDIADITTRGY